jgi:hypothetical protein
VNYCGRSFVCYNEGIFTILHNNIERKPSQWLDHDLQGAVHDLIKTHILPNLDQPEVTLLTQCKRNGVLFRAHPHYKGNTTWQDWAYIDWHEAGLIPAHLLIYVDLMGLKRPFTLHQNPIDTPGIYAICHSVLECLENKPMNLEDDQEDNYKAHQSSELVLFAYKELVDNNLQPPFIRHIKKKRKKNPPKKESVSTPQAKLYLISCDAIEEECTAVPDVGSIHCHGYLFLRSRKHWCNILLDFMEENRSNKNEI